MKTMNMRASIESVNAMTRAMEDEEHNLSQVWATVDEEPKEDPMVRFRKDAATFMALNLDAVSREIRQLETQLQDVRRKRQEMVAAAQRLGI